MTTERVWTIEEKWRVWRRRWVTTVGSLTAVVVILLVVFSILGKGGPDQRTFKSILGLVGLFGLFSWMDWLSMRRAKSPYTSLFASARDRQKHREGKD